MEVFTKYYGLLNAKDELKKTATNIRSSLSVSNLTLCSPNETDSKKQRWPNYGSIKNRKSASSEDSFNDVSPYGSLSRNDLRKHRGATAVVAPVATAGCATPTGVATKGHSKLQSLFNPFSKVQDKQEQLSDLLTNYSLNGLPKMPDLLTLGRPHYDLHMFQIESHWTDVVMNHHALNKRQRDQQEAIWELLTTEVEYIHTLKVIMDLFMCCLLNLQNEQILQEIEAEKLFSNIGDVFYATCHFWTIHMSQVLKQARGRRELLNPCLLKAGFLVFEKIFDPYTKYCLEQENCREYIKQKTKENDLFRTFILWAESQKQCNRLKLVDLIVKPFQRLTKYKLLLYAMRKPLDKMDATLDVEEQKKDINTMIEQVEDFVFRVNVAMRQRYDYKQMSQMIDRIESYDAIEAPSEECIKLVSKFCRLDLTCPVPGCGQQQMRILLLEGSLKLRDTYSKMDVYCFLFTDMLLITKPTAKRGDRVKIIKPPMRLDKIIVHSLRDVASFMLLYLNEYHVAQAVYTFHGDSKLWLDNVIKAQNDYREKRHSYLTRTDTSEDNNIIDPDESVFYANRLSPATANSTRHVSPRSADDTPPAYSGVQRSSSCLSPGGQGRGDSPRLPDGQRPCSAVLMRSQSYRSQLSVPYGRLGKVSSFESLTAELSDARNLTVPILTRTNCSDDDDDDNDDDDDDDDDDGGKRRSGGLRSKQRKDGGRARKSPSGTSGVDPDTRSISDESVNTRKTSSSSVGGGGGGGGGGGFRQAGNLSDEEEVLSRSSHNGSTIYKPTKSVQTQTAASDLHEIAKFGNNSDSIGESTKQLSQSLPSIAGFLETVEDARDPSCLDDDGETGLSAASDPCRMLPEKRRLSCSQSSGINQDFLTVFESTLEASEI